MKTTNHFTIRAFLLVLALQVAAVVAANSQVIQVEGGTSDILNANGGSIQFQSANYRGSTSIGEIDGQFLVGSYFNTIFHSYTLTGGDFPVALDLPTDIFDSNHFILTRGLGVATKKYGTDIFFFGGESAIGAGTPFFQAARGDRPTAMLFLHKTLTRQFSFFSRNAFSTQQTSIQGLEWSPSTLFHAAVDGGVGANQKYFAVSGDLNYNWLSLKLGYIAAGEKFRRFTVQSPLSSEVDGANAIATLHPSRNLVIVAAHQNYLQPLPAPNVTAQKAMVNNAQADWNFHSVQLGGGLFQSVVQSRHGLSQAFWASRPINRRISAGFNYFRSRFGAQPATSTISGTVREVISPKLSLLEIVNRSNGQTQVLMGGTLITNRISLDVNYQTIYLPFSTNPFQQGLAATIQFSAVDDVQLNAQTFVAGDGKLHYTAYASKMFEKALGWFGSSQQQSYRFPRFVVKGRVVDEKGNPVGGAAIQIGKELLITNDDGEFILRLKSRQTLAFTIMFEAFINPELLHVLSAPTSITPEPADSALQIHVVLGHGAVPQKLH